MTERIENQGFEPIVPRELLKAVVANPYAPAPRFIKSKGWLSSS